MKKCELCKKEKEDVRTYSINGEELNLCERCKILSAFMNWEGMTRTKSILKDSKLDTNQRDIIQQQLDLVNATYNDETVVITIKDGNND